MKQWEAMRLLEENPEKVYEAMLVRNPWVARVRVEKGCYKFTGHDANDGDQIIQPLVEERMTLDLDWYEVKQPVPWQEAIQAWAEGKKVVWEEDAERRVFDRNRIWAIPKYQSHLLDQDGDAVTVRMVSGGKWYVED